MNSFAENYFERALARQGKPGTSVEASGPAGCWPANLAVYSESFSPDAAINVNRVFRGKDHTETAMRIVWKGEMRKRLAMFLHYELGRVSNGGSSFTKEERMKAVELYRLLLKGGEITASIFRTEVLVGQQDGWCFIEYDGDTVGPYPTHPSNQLGRCLENAAEIALQQRGMTPDEEEELAARGYCYAGWGNYYLGAFSGEADAYMFAHESGSTVLITPSPDLPTYQKRTTAPSMFPLIFGVHASARDALARREFGPVFPRHSRAKKV